MTDIISQPAEQAATMARLPACQPPRTLHELSEQAARLPCRCGARQGSPCVVQGGRVAYHVGRFAAARRCGLITAAETDAVLVAAGDVFTILTLVAAGAAGAR